MEPQSTNIPRDISWLNFNARVLQEANDPTVPLKERIRFLGIHSNNQDEFFRVRVASLKRMEEVGASSKKIKMHLEQSPTEILEGIYKGVLEQQAEFNRIWNGILDELKELKIHLRNETQLSVEQRSFVTRYYDDVVSPNLIPLMIQDIPTMPYLRDKSIYLAVAMWKKSSPAFRKYSLIEVPVKGVGSRFVQLPSKRGETDIMLLEDVVRFNLPQIFSFFDFDSFSAHLFKLTKDAEIEIDEDFSSSFVQKIEKGLKQRREGKPVRLVHDKEMDKELLGYLMGRLNLTYKDNIIAGGRIHNFRHFMEFPDVVPTRKKRKSPFTHPDLDDGRRIEDVVMEKDVMLSFPYHSFMSVVHMLREAAMDSDVHTIKLTAYRLASQSKIVNALINAVRNGKKVVVFMELRARFDEEANLYWRDVLEQEGVKVLNVFPDMKVHAKLCLIQKKVGKTKINYGLVSTGNLNEKTARIYGDQCILTSRKQVTDDIISIFNYLEKPDASMSKLKACKTLWVSPVNMRKNIQRMINHEISNARAGKPAKIIIKVNSLSDQTLIDNLYRATQAGVELFLIVRGIYCANFENLKPKPKVIPYAISIVDEYLEHARVMAFHNNGNAKVFISSADFMVRNLDHRVEACIPITDEKIKEEMLEILEIQLRDNVKARVHSPDFKNEYLKNRIRKKTKSQVETYRYLAAKKLESPSHPRHNDKDLIELPK